MSKSECKEKDATTKPLPIFNKLLAKGFYPHLSKIEDFLPSLSDAELIGLFEEVSADDMLQYFVVHGFFALSQERLVGILSTHTVELIQTLNPNGKYNFTNSIFKLDKAILSQILTPDNTLGLFKKIEVRDMGEFIDSLFSLPKDIIQPIITTHKMSMFEASGALKGYFAIKLLKSFPQQASDPAIAITSDNVLQIAAESGGYQSLFISALLKLPAKQLESIVTHDNMATLFSKSKCELEFIHKLLELPKGEVDDILTPSNMKEIFTWILKPNYRHATTNQKLLDAFEVKDIKLPIEVTKDLDFSASKDLIFLKLAPSAIDFIEQDRIQDLDPLVAQLLSKTHVQVSNTEAGRSFTNSWIDGLNKIIQANPSLTIILQNAAKESGDIFVTSSEYIKTSNSDSTGGFLNPADLIIGIANGINNPVHALDILIHEATHKLIQNIYQNDMLPYHKGYDSNFNTTKEAMSAEVAKEKVLYSRVYIDKWYEAGLSIGNKLSPKALDSLPKESWLKTMVDSYSKEKLAIEIFPWFTQQIARHILGNQEFGDVGQELAEHLWDYLNKYLTSRHDPESVPPFCYHDYASLQDEEGSLTYNAKKLVTTSESSVRWLDDEVGQLAFQSLPLSEQRAFISSERGLDKSNVVKVFECSPVPSYTLIDKLFALPHEKLLSIVTHDNIHSLIGVSGDFKFILIDKILALAPEDIASIITYDNFPTIQAVSGIYAYKLQGLLPPSPDEVEVIVQSAIELPSVEDAECTLVAELPRIDECKSYYD